MPTESQFLEISYLINEKDLNKIETYIKQRGYENIKYYASLNRRTGIYEIKSVESLIEALEQRKGHLTALTLDARLPIKDETGLPISVGYIEIQFKKYGIEVQVSTSEFNKINEIIFPLANILSNFKVWYSHIPNWFIATSLAAIILNVVYIDELRELLEKSSTEEDAKDYFTIFILVPFIAMFIFDPVAKLFPSAQFEIAQGKKRVKLIRWLHGILASSVLIPIIFNIIGFK